MGFWIRGLGLWASVRVGVAFDMICTFNKISPGVSLHLPSDHLHVWWSCFNFCNFEETSRFKFREKEVVNVPSHPCLCALLSLKAGQYIT